MGFQRKEKPEKQNKSDKQSHVKQKFLGCDMKMILWLE
jgi:hypothetical protein